MEVLGFVLENEAKVHRALRGTQIRGDKFIGGVERMPGYKEMSEEEQLKALIAEYDKLGGYITKNDIKVKMGSFYDFLGRKPRTEPELSFLTKLDGEMVEVDEEEAQSIKKAKKRTAELKAKKKKAKNKKKK